MAPNESGEEVISIWTLSSFLGPKDYMQPLGMVLIKDLMESTKDSIDIEYKMTHKRI